jgi:hypothetical protein
MDRDALLQKLLLFEQQIADGEVQIVRQENLITKMEVDGQDTAEATTLITMRTTLTQLRQERRRILDLLDE